MLDEEDWGLGMGNPALSSEELRSMMREDAEWKARRTIGTKLSNGDIVWCTKVYEHRYNNIVFETISEDEYIVRKLAGTLKHVHNKDDFK